MAESLRDSMSRYSTYGPTDAVPVQDGDSGFIGVDSYNLAENLPPGTAQSAVNMDFSTGEAVTRGGFVCLPALGARPFGNDWASATAPMGPVWSDIVYGGGVFVAVAFSGSLNQATTSPDGITWASQTTPDGAWIGVTYGAGLFVAVGNGANKCMTSSDGITWIARSVPQTCSGVAYGGGLFVAVGPTGVAMSSPDGITWTSRIAATGGWNDVVYGSSGFVAVASSGTNRAMSSQDGVTWSGVAAITRSWVSVAFGNSLYVAVAISGTGDRVMTSPDGLTWTSRASAADNPWNSVCFGNGQFVAVSDSGSVRVMTSYDGISWVLASSSISDSWQAVTFGNNTFVAIALGASGAVQYLSAVRVWASGIYSDPNDPGSEWITLVGRNKVGFYAFGRTARTVAIDPSYTVTEMSTVVQCNNLVYIFRGFDVIPLYWTGDWAATFTAAPTPTPATGFTIIPNSNQATYYQNRLWIIASKDDVDASDVLDFDRYDILAADFNLNTGSSDYLVTTFPFGTTTLIVFKHKSIIALTAVDGSLGDVVATEITRQVGCIGINAVCTVGSDLVYLSDRHVNLLTLTTTSNAVQHKTLPLSTPIKSIMNRVNWLAASKVSMAYFDNKIFIALPLDNATSCQTVVVYNFITEKWFGEWNFASAMGITIQGWVVANYLGATRLHCITEDGRVFVTNEGQNDISGVTVSEISTSLVTRAYRMDNEIKMGTRMYADLATNRPNYSIATFSDGASESSIIKTDQTYSRSDSWLFNDAVYALDNSNDDYNRAYRKDYSTGPDSIQSGSGFQPEMTQDFRIPIISRRRGRLGWVQITNSTGFIAVKGIGMEMREGDRRTVTQV